MVTANEWGKNVALYYNKNMNFKALKPTVLEIIQDKINIKNLLRSLYYRSILKTLPIFMCYFPPYFN